MKMTKLLTIVVMGLLAGNCLLFPVSAEGTEGEGNANETTYTITATAKRIDELISL